MKANKNHIFNLAQEIGCLKYFNPPKYKHPKWKKYDLAAYYLHELGHLVMGHLPECRYGQLSKFLLSDASDRLLNLYHFTERQYAYFVETMLEIPYQPDEWSVQAWCVQVSNKHGWTNTYGRQWATNSPSKALRETAFLRLKDNIGLTRSGIDIDNNIYHPTYTHLYVKKTKVFVYSGDVILDEADITKIINCPQIIKLFNRIKLLKMPLAPCPF